MILDWEIDGGTCRHRTTTQEQKRINYKDTQHQEWISRALGPHERGRTQKTKGTNLYDVFTKPEGEKTEVARDRGLGER